MKQPTPQETARQKYKIKYSKRPKLKKTTWSKIRQMVIDRDGMTCTYCGCDVFINPDDKKTSLVVEHMYTREETLDNLCVACRRCNSQKNSKSFQEWLLAIEIKLLTETSATEIRRFIAQKLYIQGAR